MLLRLSRNTFVLTAGTERCYQMCSVGLCHVGSYLDDVSVVYHVQQVLPGILIPPTHPQDLVAFNKCGLIRKKQKEEFGMTCWTRWVKAVSRTKQKF